MNWWTKLFREGDHGDDDGDEAQKSDGGARKEQFNTTIDPGLAMSVKLLAAEYGVPMWVVAEHAIYVGALHLAIASQNRSKKDALHKHLSKRHLLATQFKDSPAIARINEVAYPAELLAQIRNVIKLVNDYAEVLEMIASGRRTPEVMKAKQVTGQYLSKTSAMIIMELDQLESKERRGDTYVGAAGEADDEEDQQERTDEEEDDGDDDQENA